MVVYFEMSRGRRRRRISANEYRLTILKSILILCISYVFNQMSESRVDVIPGSIILVFFLEPDYFSVRVFGYFSFYSIIRKGS